MENSLIGNIIANKYLILNKIGQGSFGSIYKGENQRTKEQIAIKIEKISHQTNLLKNESKIFQFLKEIIGIPNVKWYGKDEINYYMVIPLLGDSLQNFRKNSSFLSPFFLTAIFIQLLKLIEAIHSKGLIHRDIKPDNFLFGIKNKNLFLIDFGLCKFYSMENQHIPFKKTKSLIGSVNYTSKNSHEHFELSRRDDLISLGYIIIFLIKGDLDWSFINIHENKRVNLSKIWELKKNIFKQKDLPVFLCLFFEYCYCLKFEETPNYLYLENLLNEYTK